MAVASCGAAQQAELIDSYHWRSDDPTFGGISAVEVTGDGTGFFALSDRARILTGEIVRDGDGIADVRIATSLPLSQSDGGTLSRDQSDSEGLALLADGRLFASFEWRHGVRMIDPATGRVGPLLTSPLFDGMQDNSSLEALAVDAEGALYTLPERSGQVGRPFPGYRLSGETWQVAFAIPRRDAFLPVGADIGPDGLFYLLERDFVGIGFRSRVRRFALDGSGEVTLLETALLAHDNLEGISVWQDTGGLRMTLVSDDNFRSLQRTQIVEYRLTP